MPQFRDRRTGQSNGGKRSCRKRSICAARDHADIPQIPVPPPPPPLSQACDMRTEESADIPQFRVSPGGGGATGHILAGSLELCAVGVHLLELRKNIY